MASNLSNIWTLWQRFIEPAAAIQDLEQRRKARLLSALLLVLTALGTFDLVISVAADYDTHSPNVSPYILIGIINITVLLALYALSRTRHYKLSAGLTLAMLYIATVAVGLSIPREGITQILPYLSISVLLCSMLFSLRTTIILAAVGILGVLALPLLSLAASFLSILYPAIFVAMMTALIAVAVRQRDLIEMDRRGVQKKIEDALRDSESRLQSLVTSISDLVFAVDLDGRFLFYHAPVPPAANTPIVSMKEFVGYRVRDMMPAPVAALLEQSIEQVTQTLTTQPLDYNMEIDDEVRSFSARVSPMISADLKLIGVTVVARDVTEAVQARQRQQRLLEFDNLTRVITTSFFQSNNSQVAINEMLRQIGEFLAVTRIQIFELTDNGHFMDCTYEWQIDGDAPTIQFLKHLDFQKNMPSLLPMLNEAGIISASYKSELPQAMYDVFRMVDMQSLMCLPIQVDGIVHGLIALVDSQNVRQWLPEEISMIRTIAEHLSRVMERERSQLALIQARDAALRSAQLKSEFMSNMSHEVRTPMTGLMGMLELLLETELSGDQREFADTAFSSAHNLLGILDDILDFSKIEAGRVLLEAKPIDPRSIANEVRNTLSMQAAKKKIRFETAIGPEVPARVFCDPTRLRQILINLASNAIKFTAEGSVTINIREVGNAPQRSRLRFEVQDTGIGIDPDQKQRIFESFVQADGTTTRKYGGTGLGLAISKQLVQLMGGEIDVTSESRQGSTFGFTLTLPVDEGSSAESPFARIASLRILVVDDQAASRHVLVQQLRLWGAHVVDLADKNQLLPFLLEKASSPEPIDVVFLASSTLADRHRQLVTTIRDALKDKTPRLVHLDNVHGSGAMADNGFDAHLPYPFNQTNLYDLLLTKDNYPSPEAQDRQPDSKPVRVLVADDNVINQRIVTRALLLEKMTVDVARNGEEALDFYAKNHYDLVLMDVHMPQLDGLEATRIIRSMNGEAGQVPVIALTASVLPEEKDRCLAAGMSAVLGKPFSIEQLRTEVQKWLTDGATEPTERHTS